MVEKQGTKTRRSWRKLHIGLNADTGQIVAATLTRKEIDDGAEVGPLLEQVRRPVASFTADGAYDQEGVAAAVAERHPAATITVPPPSGAVPSDTAATAPTQLDITAPTVTGYDADPECWCSHASVDKSATRTAAEPLRFGELRGEELQFGGAKASAKRKASLPAAGASGPSLERIGEAEARAEQSYRTGVDAQRMADATGIPRLFRRRRGGDRLCGRGFGRKGPSRRAEAWWAVQTRASRARAAGIRQRGRAAVRR